MDPNELLRVASGVRLLILDVDGVLTDGAMYYDASGEAMKRFHTRDAAGLARVRKLGIEVAWLSGEDSAITMARARKLQIDHVVLGCADKLAAADALRCRQGLTWPQIAYMGDDWFDVSLLRQVGLSACPADAHAEVQAMAAFRTAQPGGNGAVREICDLLVEAHQHVRAQ